VGVGNNKTRHKKTENHTAVIIFRKLSAVKQAVMQQIFFKIFFNSAWRSNNLQHSILPTEPVTPGEHSYTATLKTLYL
jgi:hypothetical protein